MSQYGAKAMAELGFSYTDILSFILLVLPWKGLDKLCENP